MHIPLEFDDGVKWIARARHVGVGVLPRLMEREVLQSEMDTMRWLEKEGMTVAKVVSDIYSKLVFQ